MPAGSANGVRAAASIANLPTTCKPEAAGTPVSKMEPETPPAPADEADVLASLHEKVDELARTMFFSLNSIRRREGAGEGELGAEVAALSSSLAASSKEIDALIDRIPGLDRTAE